MSGGTSGPEGHVVLPHSEYSKQVSFSHAHTYNYIINKSYKYTNHTTSSRSYVSSLYACRGICFLCIYKYSSLAKKGPWAVHIILCAQTRGWVDICNIAAFYHEKAPMFTLSQPTQDIAHQHIRPVLLATMKFWIAGGDASFEFTGIVRISRSNEPPKCT